MLFGSYSIAKISSLVMQCSTPYKFDGTIDLLPEAIKI
jgi:hypothetical protein